MVFAVFFGGRQQLVKRNEDHDAGNPGKQKAEHRIVEKRHQNEIAENCADRLGHAGKKRIHEGFAAAAGRVVDRYRDCDSFGNVVNGDGKCDADAEFRVMQSGSKSGEPFRKVVNGNRNRREDTHAMQTGGIRLFDRAAFFGTVFEFADFVCFMRVFKFRNQLVDQGDEKHAAEKGDRGVPVAFGWSDSRDQRVFGLDKNFDHRHVDHDAGREAEGNGKKAFAGFFRKKGEQAADAGGQTGQHGQHEGGKKVFCVHLVSVIMAIFSQR